MALVLADRVKETTVTTGTGTVTLAGAMLGFQSFSVIGNGNTTYYCVAGQGTSEWEVGIGTYTASGATLSRNTVLASSNANALVNFSAGTKEVFVAYPAERSANLQSVDTAPTSAEYGSSQFWYDTTNGVLLVNYNGQWVEGYDSQLTTKPLVPDMDGGTASTSTWNYSINCGGAA